MQVKPPAYTSQPESGAGHHPGNNPAAAEVGPGGGAYAHGNYPSATTNSNATTTAFVYSAPEPKPPSYPEASYTPTHQGAPSQVELLQSKVTELPTPSISYNQRIFYLLGFAFVVPIVALSASMVGSWGVTTFFITPAAAGATIVYSLVLFVLVRRDLIRRSKMYELHVRHTQLNNHDPARPELVVTDVAAQGNYGAGRGVLGRAPTAFATWLLCVAWTAAFLVLVGHLVARALKREFPGGPLRTRSQVPVIVEIIAVAYTSGVMQNLIKYCKNERRNGR